MDKWLSFKNAFVSFMVLNKRIILFRQLPQADPGPNPSAPHNTAAKLYLVALDEQ